MSSALSFNHLPLDVLFGVFFYLDVADILRIRRVSQYLNEVTRCRDVWADAYRTADFIRPPGPFLSQSAYDLENALVASFRVDRNIRHSSTTQQGMPTLRKRREIRYTGVDLRVNLIFGRFLLIALREEVRCYDLSIDALDCHSGATIIYRSTSGRTLKSFHCVSAFDIEGCPFACVVLNETVQGGRTEMWAFSNICSIYSLNVGEHSEVTLVLLHQFEHSEFNIRSVDLGPRVIIVQGRAPHDNNWRVIALDVHACTLFLLPSFTDVTQEADEASEWMAMTPLTSISTSSHLLLARSLYTLAAGWSTSFRAFALPLSNVPRLHITHLTRSHSGNIPGISVRDVVLLHDATLEPPTQDILIIIRVHAFEPSRPHIALSIYGTLRLGRTHDEVGTITFKSLGSLGQLSRFSSFHPSFNGTGRAFYTLEPRSYGTIGALEYDVRNNGDDESKGKVIEYPSVIRFHALRTLLDYDPYSGRICLQSTMAKYSVIEILDLAT